MHFQFTVEQDDFLNVTALTRHTFLKTCLSHKKQNETK